MVLVVVHENQALFHGYGETAPDSHQVPTQESMLRLCSLTKIFTSDVFAKLIADGTVKLDDPLQRFAPRHVRSACPGAIDSAGRLWRRIFRDFRGSWGVPLAIRLTSPFLTIRRAGDGCRTSGCGASRASLRSTSNIARSICLGDALQGSIAQTVCGTRWRNARLIL